MKTTTPRLLLLKPVLLFMVVHAFSQDLVGTRIDLQGSRFSDQMWLFSVASCTYNFDNGWDGFKMFGTSLAPQLFAMEPDGYYQVASVPDINNTYLGFKAGIDTDYTFTFTHQNLAVRYQQLFLIDSVANKIVNIYQSGTTYSFIAQTTTEPVKRFKIVTLKPVDQTEESNQPGSILTTFVQPTSNVNNLNIFISGKNISILNNGYQKGKMTLFNAETGKVFKTMYFNAKGTSIMNANIPVGIYSVNGKTQSDNVSEKIIIR